MAIALIDQIEPKNSGSFPILQDKYLKGGFRVVANAIERDAITDQRRSIGMFVYVIAEESIYTLVGGIANSNWEEISLGGGGQAWKAPVRIVCVENIELTGLQTIDGALLVADERVLVANQDDPIENGIYLAAEGAWVRSKDLRDGFKVAGSAVAVTEGTSGADSVWLCITDSSADVVGTDPVTFIKVTPFTLEDGSVTTPKLANGAVTTTKLADAAVTTEKLADGSVTTAKIADLSVTTGKLVNLAVTTEKLGEWAVTTDKMADAAVTTNKLKALSVTTSRINDAAVTTDKLAENSVTSIALAEDGFPTPVNQGQLTTKEYVDNKIAYLAAQLIKANFVGVIAGPIEPQSRWYPHRELVLKRAYAVLGVASEGFTEIEIRKNGVKIPGAKIVIGPSENRSVTISISELLTTSDYITVAVMSAIGGENLVVNVEYL